jgi:hypothetical protein
MRNERIAGISSFYEQGHKGRRVCPEYQQVVKAAGKSTGAGVFANKTEFANISNH